MRVTHIGSIAVASAFNSGQGHALSDPRHHVTVAVIALCRMYQLESGRYHVYVGNACPWCHRVLLVLALTGAQT